jgi:hypothetical protein
VPDLLRESTLQILLPTDVTNTSAIRLIAQKHTPALVAATRNTSKRSGGVTSSV